MGYRDFQDLKSLRQAKGRGGGARRAQGRQVVGKTLSLDLPLAAAGGRPSSALRKERSALALTRPASLRLNTLDGVSSVYQMPGGAGARTTTPVAGATRPRPVPAPHSRHHAGGNRRHTLSPEPVRASASTSSINPKNGGKAEIFEALYKLDSMERGVRIQACHEVFEHVILQDQAFGDILGRVKQEYDEDRRNSKRERETLKQSLAELRQQEQHGKDATESLQQEYQALHTATDDMQAQYTKLQEDFRKLQQQTDTAAAAHAAQAAAQPAEDTSTKAAAASASAAGSSQAAASQAASEASGDSVVLADLLDKDYAPSEEEVLEYAEQLGMNLAQDMELLWIARKGLRAPLPEGWKPCGSPEGEVYFFNFNTGESVWDRPGDARWRALYVECKAKKEEGIVITEADLPDEPEAPVPAVYSDSEGEDEDEEPQVPLEPLPLARPSNVPALDFDLLAQVGASHGLTTMVPPCLPPRCRTAPSFEHWRRSDRCLPATQRIKEQDAEEEQEQEAAEQVWSLLHCTTDEQPTRAPHQPTEVQPCAVLSCRLPRLQLSRQLRCRCHWAGRRPRVGRLVWCTMSTQRLAPHSTSFRR